MNKILFKLIEGKGKFFLMRDVPNEPRPCMLMNKIYGPTVPEKRHYQEDLNACISEALKNGEIVNPEVIHIDWGLTKAGSGGLNNGQIFDFPEGMGFEEFEKCIECEALTSEDCKNSPDNCDVRNRNFVRLLPEKPVQKEESQEELWNQIANHCMDKKLGIVGIILYIREKFTIKRKES